MIFFFGGGGGMKNIWIFLGGHQETGLVSIIRPTMHFRVFS